MRVALGVLVEAVFSVDKPVRESRSALTRNLTIVIAIAAMAGLFYIAQTLPPRRALTARWILMSGNAFLIGWFLTLSLRRLWTGRAWSFEPYLRMPNLIQACVQCSIYVYMSQYSGGVQSYLTLIIYQVLFGFLFDLLLSLTVYGNARLGFTTLPIVLSINLFIWFKPSWFYCQLLMVAGALVCKYFLVRTVNGVRTHVFNPSAIAMALATIVLLFVGPREYTFQTTIIDTYHSARPGVIPFIFVVASISQWVGGVSLVALGAFFTLHALSTASEVLAGLPLINHWIDPAVFVGVSLLITDPATTPKSRWGKFLFGCSYGVGIIVAYIFLSYARLPGYYAKILAVPLLNILAPRFDALPYPFRAPQLAQLAVGMGRQWVQTTVYALVFLLLLPSIPSGRQQSLIGTISGDAWAEQNKR